MRALAELALVLAAAAIPVGPTPLVPMIAVASLVLWIGGRGWGELGLRGGQGAAPAALAGIAAGVIAVAALALVDPEALVVGPMAAARGSVGIAIVAVVLAGAAAMAAEMVRGFAIARLEIACGGRPLAAVIVAALAWAVVFAPATPLGALGAFAAAAGFGLLHLADGKRMVAAIAAHVAYDAGAVLAAVA